MKYYLVGTVPVRVTFRNIGGQTLPVSAEVKDTTTGQFKFSGDHMTMIDDGQEVSEIDKPRFDALTR